MSQDVGNYLNHVCQNKRLIPLTILYFSGVMFEGFCNNVYSIKAKIEDLRQNYSVNAADILCFSETWLTSRDHSPH